MQGLRRSARATLEKNQRLRRHLEARRRRQAIDFYGEFVSPGALCFDIGANVGDRTELFRTLGARTVAVEPQSACAQELERRFGRDPEVIVVPIAVGDSPGSAEIAVCEEDPTISTMSSRWRTESRFADRTWTRSETVRVTTLDRLIDEHGSPSFCKIDVEGFERTVLEGLSSPIPCVSFEFTRELLDDARACIGLLESLGPVVANASIGESMRLMGSWRDSVEVLAAIEQQPPSRDWGDIYVRSLSIPPSD